MSAEFFATKNNQTQKRKIYILTAQFHLLINEILCHYGKTKHLLVLTSASCYHNNGMSH